MKKTTKKLSLGMKIASVLACLAIVSVGFASWWIVKPPETKTANGSFTVYAVSTKNVTISEPTFTTVKLDLDGVLTDMSSSNIIFGKKAFSQNAGTNYNWLHAGKEIYDENLTATMNFTVSVTDGEGETGTSDIYEFLKNVNLSMPVDQKIRTAIGDGYLADGEVSYSYTVGETENTGKADITSSTETLSLDIDMSGAVGTENSPVYTVDVTVEFKFGWGTKFEGQNPYTYFNKQAYSEPLAGTASSYLTAVNELSTVTYTVTLKGTMQS